MPDALLPGTTPFCLTENIPSHSRLLTHGDSLISLLAASSWLPAVLAVQTRCGVSIACPVVPSLQSTIIFTQCLIRLILCSLFPIAKVICKWSTTQHSVSYHWTKQLLLCLLSTGYIVTGIMKASSKWFNRSTNLSPPPLDISFFVYIFPHVVSFKNI